MALTGGNPKTESPKVYAKGSVQWREEEKARAAAGLPPRD
jgi:hypothetical protein